MRFCPPLYSSKENFLFLCVTTWEEINSLVSSSLTNPPYHRTHMWHACFSTWEPSPSAGIDFLGLGIKSHLLQFLLHFFWDFCPWSWSPNNSALWELNTVHLTCWKLSSFLFPGTTYSPGPFPTTFSSSYFKYGTVPWEIEKHKSHLLFQYRLSKREEKV